ncbi:MAG: tyrosine--tRNA ligase [Eubacteriales bacterium]|nr:tyrosine--tRNA ligase [Eubacteriales bacterium]
MKKNVYDILAERGFIEQSTNEEAVRELLGGTGVPFYIGFDATADSLTAGHFVTIMAMMHMQRAGHVPIALLGGGTTMIGDPSARTDMRKMMTRETIAANAERFRRQISRYLDFSKGKGHIANNADWLLNLNYVEFMREIAVHFNVKHMLQAECYKQRVDKGLTFFEFNYMLMQSYDFYKLYKEYGCLLEMGGNDQWSNIIGGVDLVRLKERKQVYGLTLKLLTTSEGIKMGKTMKGALWLDPEKTSPFEFFQYWRNVEDVKVEECLGLLTFLPMDEVRRLGALEGAEVNRAKEVLAYEITKIVHGEEEAKRALDGARAMFSQKAASDNAPVAEYTQAELDEGIELIGLLVDLKMENSRSDARRSIKQGGVSINGDKITDVAKKLSVADFTDGDTVILRKGKKKVHQIKMV